MGIGVTSCKCGDCETLGQRKVFLSGSETSRLIMDEEGGRGRLHHSATLLVVFALL